MGYVFTIDLGERAEAVGIVGAGVLEPTGGSFGGMKELIVGDLGECGCGKR